MYINNDIDWLKHLKNKNVYIFGAGKNGKSALIQLEKHGIVIKGFIDNNDAIKSVEGKKCFLPTIWKEQKKQNAVIVICSRHEREMKQQLIDIYNFCSISQIDFYGDVEAYYDDSYFSWQSALNKFGAEISLKLFQPYIKEDMNVLEFGSSGGALLALLNAREKIGIEINPVAREAAKKIGIRSVGHADVIISSHVLEHVENPLRSLRLLRSKLMSGGKAVFYVPNESCYTEYKPNDKDFHLYTWNCLNIGNLFKAAGYFVHSVTLIQEMWPDNFSVLKERFGNELFFDLTDIKGKAFENNSCLIVAYKP